MKIALPSGEEPISVLSLGAGDSVESRIAKNLLDIDEPLINNLPNQIEDVLDGYRDLSDEELGVFEEELKEAYRRVVNKTLNEVTNDYDISYNEGRLGNYKLKQLFDDTFKNKILGGSRFELPEYTREQARSFVKDNMVEIKTQEWETSSASYKMKNVSFTEFEHWDAPNSKANAMINNNVQPYNKPISELAEDSMGFSEFTRAKVSGDEVDPVLVDKYLRESKDAIPAEYRRKIKELEKYEKRVQNIFDELYKNTEDPKFKQIYDTIQDLRRGLPKDFDRVKYSGSQTSMSAGEMTEFNRGFDYLRYTIPIVERQLKAIDSFPKAKWSKSKAQKINYLQTQKDVKEMIKQINKIKKTITRKKLEEGIRALYETPEEFEEKHGEYFRQDRNTLSKEKMKEYFDNPVDFIRDYLPLNLVLYEITFSIRAKTETKQDPFTGEEEEQTTYTIHEDSDSSSKHKTLKDRIKNQVDLYPIGFKPSTSTPRILGEKINIENELEGTVADREFALNVINKLSRNNDDLNRAGIGG